MSPDTSSMKQALPLFGILSIVVPVLGFLQLLVCVLTHSASLGSALIAMFFAPSVGFIFGVVSLIIRERPSQVAIFGLVLSIAPALLLVSAKS
jgi:hypothetical protein